MRLKRSNIAGKGLPPAVILGLGINGLGIARSLGAKGIEVWGIHDRYDDFGRYSRHCNAVLFPPLMNGKEEFLQKLINQFGNAKNRPVLFMQSDLYVMFVSQNRSLLKKYFRFSLPDHELLMTLVSKERSAQFVVSKGLKIPETYFLDKKKTIEKNIEKIKYPCLMKPVDSFSTSFEKKTLIFSDKNLLEAFLRERGELIGRVIIQQIIPGGDTNTYQATTYVSEDAKIFPIFTMRKIRQRPPDFGITSYGISEEVPQIREKVQNFIKSMPYYGFISVEFKQHPQTMEWIYIELNPRLPYYNKLIYDSGINFPYIYYNDLLGLNPGVTSIRRQRNGVRWIYLVGDFYSFKQKYSQGHINFFNWFMSVIKSNSYAVFDGKDLTPFLRNSIHLIKSFFKKVLNTSL